MISNKIADRIIATALSEKRKMDAKCHAGRESHNQPLGYHVFTVADAVAPDHRIPYSGSAEGSNDSDEIRNYLLGSGQ